MNATTMTLDAEATKLWYRVLRSFHFDHGSLRLHRSLSSLVWCLFIGLTLLTGWSPSSSQLYTIAAAKTLSPPHYFLEAPPYSSAVTSPSESEVTTTALNMPSQLPSSMPPSISAFAGSTPARPLAHRSLPVFPNGNQSSYDDPVHAPSLTDQEFQETWYGLPETLKIGVLLPFTNPDRLWYSTPLSRISMSVLRMAVKDMNDRQVIPGMNISLVVRDSQQATEESFSGGGAPAISAATRLMSKEVAGVIGDISSDLTMLEALLTSSVGIPQCTFASYNMDDQHMANFRYLFRTSPGVSSFLDALVEVVTFYGWRRISVIHTMDVPGLIGEKRFSDACEKRGIYVQKVELPILNRGDDGDLTTIVHNAMRRVRATNTRIHILIAQRRVQVPILNLIRNNGLFQKSHVWMTPIDLSDSLNRLENPSDFAGLIMADARWGMPEFPAYNEFVNRWMDLNQTEYPLSGSTRLSWHETYAYTCVQVIAEAYGALVRQTHTITNKTERDFQLGEIKRGRKASEISMGFIGSQWYTTPIGNFTTDTTGIPIINRISIISFQNSTGVYNGKYINGALEMTTPIVFSDGTTTVPRSFPGSEELNPHGQDPFNMTMRILATILLAVYIVTAIVVVLNRDNIIIKSASPLFCVIELFGMALSLSWILLRTNVPTDNMCRIGLMVIVVGLSINLSALVVKNYRIYRIFNSMSVINHAVSNKYLLRVVAVPVLLTLVPCIIHVFEDYLVPTMVFASDGNYWVACWSTETQLWWNIGIGITPILLDIFGLYLAFKTRNVTKLWNEARAIALTLYIFTFFVVLIIIVNSFPSGLYPVSYYVTMVGVFLASLAEYLTLFFPKMRNLWLQKHGLNVRAGREEDTIESLGGGPEGISKRGVLSKNKEYTREQRRLAETFNDSPFNFGSTGEAAPSGDKNLNISDLVSSYPFGQLGSDPNVPPIGSPPQRTCLYSQPNPMKRGIRHPHDPEDVQSEGQDTATNSQPGLFQAHSGGVADSPASGSKDCRTTPKAGLFIINPTGLNVFTQDNRLSSMRSSQDAQSYGLHEILMASPNQSRGVENPSDFRAGKMSETPECTGSRHGGMGPPQPRTGHDQGAMLDPYLRSGSSSASRFAGMDFSDIDPFSRKSSVGDMDFTSSGQTRAWKSNKSPRICPFPGAQSSLTSGMHPQRAIKMDSYTITVPVQRQRWYILRVLAQWRMSKVVFVPYSKVLVIIDLETERAESLILHSIEPGYWSQEEEEARIAMRRSSTISALSRDGLLDLSCSRAENISGDTVAPTILEARGDAGTGSQGHPLAAPPVVRTPSPLLGVQPRYTSPLDRPYRPRSQHASDRSHIEGGPTAHLGRSSNPNPPIEEMIDRGRSASLPLTRIDVVATSARTSTDAGPARRGILRRMSDYKVLKNVRSRISIPFFADFSARNMDGIRAREDGTSVIEEGVGNSKSVAASFIEDADDNGSEGGDFIVRVISIHHECWRVQLPDRETMERWIEVGQMIKDENWISARPLTLNHSYQSGNGNATVGPWSRGRFGSFSSTAVLGGGSGSGAGTVGDDDTRPRSLRNERGSPFQRHNQGEASAAGMTTSMPVDITAPYPKRPLKDRVVLDNMERKGTSDYRHTRDIGLLRIKGLRRVPLLRGRTLDGSSTTTTLPKKGHSSPANSAPPSTIGGRLAVSPLLSRIQREDRSIPGSVKRTHSPPSPQELVPRNSIQSPPRKSVVSESPQKSPSVTKSGSTPVPGPVFMVPIADPLSAIKPIDTELPPEPWPGVSLEIGGATKPSSVPEASEESGKVRRGSSQLLRPSNQDRIDSNATSVSETFGGSGLQSLHHRHDRRRSSGDISGSICSINNGNTNSSIDSITSFDSSSAGDSSREIPYKMALPLLPSTLQEVTHALAPFDTLHPLETSVSTRLGKTPLIRLSQTYTDDIEVNSSVLGTKSFHASNYPAFGDGTASEIDQRLENDQDHSSSWVNPPCEHYTHSNKFHGRLTPPESIIDLDERTRPSTIFPQSPRSRELKGLGVFSDEVVNRTGNSNANSAITRTESGKKRARTQTYGDILKNPTANVSFDQLGVRGVRGDENSATATVAAPAPAPVMKIGYAAYSISSPSYHSRMGNLVEDEISLSIPQIPLLSITDTIDK